VIAGEQVRLRAVRRPPEFGSFQVKAGRGRGDSPDYLCDQRQVWASGPVICVPAGQAGESEDDPAVLVRVPFHGRGDVTDVGVYVFLPELRPCLGMFPAQALDEIPVIDNRGYIGIETRAGEAHVTHYGYKVHAAVDTATGLPVAWQVRTAKASELPEVPVLLDEVTRRSFKVDIAVLDRGYDAEVIYEQVESRHIRPVILLRETMAVKKGKAAPPKCEHGVWVFAGSDPKRGASKWRCPTGECSPKSVWVKASRLHPLIPRETERFKALYHQRGAVEREFGTLKHQRALLPLRVRRIERVRLHVDLTILATLAHAAVLAAA
jgi:hypothetical protein